MKDWRITWQDTDEVGLQEHMIGTKYIRYMANMIGAESPEREWQWTKGLYWYAALRYGRRDHRTVERACRQAIAKAGLKTTVSALCYELAAIAWERREEHGIPDGQEV